MTNDLLEKLKEAIAWLTFYFFVSAVLRNRIHPDPNYLKEANNVKFCVCKFLSLLRILAVKVLVPDQNYFISTSVKPGFDDLYFWQLWRGETRVYFLHFNIMCIRRTELFKWR